MSIDRISSTPITNLSSSTYESNRQQTTEPEIEKKEQQTTDQEQQQRQPSKGYLEKAVQGVNEFLMPDTTSLKFKMHEDLGEYYVQVIDDQTKEVVREIPSKEFMDMYAAMKDILGLVVDEKV